MCTWREGWEEQAQVGRQQSPEAVGTPSFYLKATSLEALLEDAGYGR